MHLLVLSCESEKEEDGKRGSVSGGCLKSRVPRVEGCVWYELLSASLPSGYSPTTLCSLPSGIG